MKQNNKMIDYYQKIYKDGKYDIVYSKLTKTDEPQLQFEHGIVNSSFNWDCAEQNSSLYTFSIVAKSNRKE